MKPIVKPNYMLQELLNIGIDIKVWSHRCKFPRFIKKKIIKKLINKTKSSIYHFIYNESDDEVAGAFTVALLNNAKLDITGDKERKRVYIFEDESKVVYDISIINTLNDDHVSALTKITIIIRYKDHVNSIITTMNNYKIEDITSFRTSTTRNAEFYDEMLINNNSTAIDKNMAKDILKDVVFKFCVNILYEDMEE